MIMGCCWVLIGTKRLLHVRIKDLKQLLKCKIKLQLQLHQCSIIITSKHQKEDEEMFKRIKTDASLQVRQRENQTLSFNYQPSSICSHFSRRCTFIRTVCVCVCVVKHVRASMKSPLLTSQVHISVWKQSHTPSVIRDDEKRWRSWFFELHGGLRIITSIYLFFHAVDKNPRWGISPLSVLLISYSHGAAKKIS